MARPLQRVHPAILQPLKRFHIVGRVGKLNPFWRGIRDGYRFIRMAGITGWVRTRISRLQAIDGKRHGVVKSSRDCPDREDPP